MHDDPVMRSIFWCGAHPAPPISSTRMEIYAAFHAIKQQGPQHLGIDNRATQVRISQLLNGSDRQRRPWAIMRDGDIWSYLQLIIAHQGRHAIAVSKVKGHATLAWETAGRSTSQQRFGNHLAGAAADWGQHLHAAPRQAYIDATGLRLQSYATSVASLIYLHITLLEDEATLQRHLVERHAATLGLSARVARDGAVLLREDLLANQSLAQGVL